MTEPQSNSETLAGSTFLAHAVPCQFENVTNINHCWRNGRNMPCFVTSWCEAKQAKLRGFSAASLNRGLRNVAKQSLFGSNSIKILSLAKTNKKRLAS